MTTSKLPPQNRDAEKAVIGGCLLESAARDVALGIVQPEDFYCDDTRRLFAVIAAMHNKEIRQIDALTVASRLERDGHLAAVGGPTFIVECLDAVPHAAHTDSYAKIIAAASQRRRAIVAGTDLTREAYDESGDIIDSLTTAEQRIHDAMETSVDDDPMEISDVLAEAIAASMTGKPTQRHIGTEWAELDVITPGIPFGGLVTLAARPGQGKSALAGCMSLRSSESGLPVLFCSYEMSRGDISNRFLSALSGVEFYKLDKNKLSAGERDQVMQAAGMMDPWPFWIDDKCRNQAMLLTLIRRMVRRKKIKLVVIDYLQLIEATDKRVNREQQVSSLMRSLKLLAMNLGIGILCLSQMNREVEKRPNREPQLSDLRESGAIEQDSDQVWFLWRPNADSERDDASGIVKVAKHRNGKTGKAELRWHPPTMRFSGNTTDPFNGR